MVRSTGCGRGPIPDAGPAALHLKDPILPTTHMHTKMVYSSCVDAHCAASSSLHRVTSSMPCTAATAAGLRLYLLPLPFPLPPLQVGTAPASQPPAARPAPWQRPAAAAGAGGERWATGEVLAAHWLQRCLTLGAVNRLAWLCQPCTYNHCIMPPPGARLPPPLHPVLASSITTTPALWVQGGGVVSIHAVHYPLLLRLRHLYSGTAACSFTHQAAAAGEALPVHLLGESRGRGKIFERRGKIP
jgi:hypothetical protein